MAARPADSVSDEQCTRRARRSVVVLAAGLLVALLAALGVMVGEARDALERPLALGAQQIDYVVAPGSSLAGVAADLERRGILEQPRYLVWLARWNGKARQVKAGEFRIRRGTTARGLLDVLVDGTPVQHSVTFVEGWTFRQALSALRAHPAVAPTLVDDSAEALMSALDRPGEHPEGRFFPDTYHFTRGTPDVEVLGRAYQAMERRLAAAWARRADGLPFETPYEALILASIVEKETGEPAERERVAGVFVRRLQRRMRLETDPTVIYGLGEAFDGNLKRAHLAADNPYNTYQRHGLTPTPIALPGAGAIEAVLNPAQAQDLYFVARGDGSHYFSRSYEEHRRAVDYFQRGKGPPPEPRR